MTTILKIDLSTSNKSLGVVAAEIADMLRGKNSPNFDPSQVPSVQVVVTGVDGLEFSEKKLAHKYKRYSGYPGGLKEVTRAKVIEKKGKGEVLRMTVLGMLPKNKLRDRFIKNLLIVE